MPVRRHITTLWRAAASALVLALGACGGGAVPENAAAPVSISQAAGQLPDKRVQTFRSSTNFAGNGWYWNAAESGTGFMFEAQGDQAFVAFFMYEAGTGKPVWYAAYGVFFADLLGNHYFAGDLRSYINGQAISATTVPPGGTSTSLGAVTINFPAGGGASVLLPGGRVMSATRFDFNGLGSTQRPHQPETGWYWNPNEGGRGYALEVQNDQLFMAMFHYNEDGSPTWNIVKGDISSGELTAPFTLYDGGQSLTSAYVRGGIENPRGGYSLNFQNPCSGQVQRAGVPVRSIRRFPIPGSGLPLSTECRAGQIIVDPPGVAPNLDSSPVPALAAYSGQIDGWLRGRDSGRFSLRIDPDGGVVGSVSLTSTPGLSLPVTGQVSVGGVIQLSAGQQLTAKGYLGPQGDLSATWSTAPDSVAGGIFLGERGTTRVLNNAAPLAVIANAPTFRVASVPLLGTGSRDPDGDPLGGYHWRLVSQPAGSAATITDERRAGARLTVDRIGDYVVALTVSDGKTDSLEVRATLRATDVNLTPFADPGPSRTVPLNAVVELDGRASTDPDSQLRYHWEFVQQPPSDTPMVFSPAMATSSQPRFTASTAGLYRVRLTVSDEQSVAVRDVVITVLPPAGSPPVAQAPRDRFAGVGNSVLLEGRFASSVPVNVRWRLTGVPPGSSNAVGEFREPNFAIALKVDVAGEYRLAFDVRDDANDANGSIDAMSVVALDLSGSWAGPLGVDSTVSSTSLSFNTDASGALVGNLAAVFLACGQSVRMEAQLNAPVEMFGLWGSYANFSFLTPATPPYTGNVNGSLAAELHSANRMSGRLTFVLPASPTCGSQLMVLPWQATRL